LRKINLKPYKVSITTPEGIKEFDYDIKTSIESILLSSGPMTEQKLSMVEVLRNARLAEKIKSAQDDILLEESEYSTLKQSFDAFKGYSGNEVEMCRRVQEADHVDVQEKRKKS
jgi:hypothetical protein